MINNDRIYPSSTNVEMKAALEQLLLSNITSRKYQELMYQIGKYLADNLLNRLDINSTYCIASTAEDADFLTKGIIDQLKDKISNISFACFWNYHYTPIKGGPSVAPIIKKYTDPEIFDAKNLIIVKSIISGSCVVRTNLIDLIQQMSPSSIYIVAPVIHSDSEHKLQQEFPISISSKFKFEFLAKDKKRNNKTGEVIPGIGGNVYKLLGFKDQDQKNRYTPKIVLDRLARQ